MLLRLQKYDLNIEYRKGELNKCTLLTRSAEHSSSLSRPNRVEPNRITTSRIIRNSATISQRWILKRI